MFKLLFYFMIIPFSFMFFFSGCGGNQNSTNLNEIALQELSSSLIKITASKERAYTGENILFTLSQTADVNSVIWKDEGGNILSSDLEYIRSFSSEGSYKIYAEVTTKSRSAQSANITIIILDPPVTDTENQSPDVSENQLPVVDAGKDIVIYEGEDVVLDAVANDPDGTIIQYLWAEGSITLGETSHLVLTGLIVGDHNISVTVTDDDGATATDYVMVYVKPPLNNAPVAYSKKIVMYVNESIAIALTGNDTDHQKLTYQIVSNPKNGSLSNNLPMVVYTPRYGYVGNDSFTYSVNDGIDNSNVATIEITILNKSLPNVPPSNNTAPSADAGEDKVITIGDDLVLHGNATNVPADVQYCWREDGRIISRSKDLSVVEADLVPGIHRLFFYVVDANGIVATDHMTLVIQEDPDSPRSVTYTYDEDGNIVKETVLHEGVPLYAYYYSYDNEGREITKSIDYDVNGIINYILSTQYDTYGNILNQRWVTAAGEEILKFIYTYDAFGNRKSEFFYVEGQLEHKIYYQYDDHCYLLSYKEYEDYEHDGVIDCITERLFDTNERVIKEFVDCDVDGVIDRTMSYTYDDNGNVLTEKIEVDINIDGQIDYVTTNTWNSNGIIVSSVYKEDMDYNGKWDTEIVVSYNANGNLTTESYIYYHYDADGNLSGKNIEYYYYDDDGNLIRTEYDDDGDGNIDRVEP